MVICGALRLITFESSLQVFIDGEVYLWIVLEMHIAFLQQRSSKLEQDNKDGGVKVAAWRSAQKPLLMTQSAASK